MGRGGKGWGRGRGKRGCKGGKGGGERRRGWGGEGRRGGGGGREGIGEAGRASDRRRGRGPTHGGFVGSIDGPVVCEVEVTEQDDLTTMRCKERGNGIGEEGLAGESIGRAVT